MRLREVRNLAATGFEAPDVERWTESRGLSTLGTNARHEHTSPEIAEMARARLMALSGVERFLMKEFLEKRAEVCAKESLPACLR